MTPFGRSDFASSGCADEMRRRSWGSMRATVWEFGVIPVRWLGRCTDVASSRPSDWQDRGTGVAPEGGRRASIPAPEWIDLRIQQRGSSDEVRRADGPIAYLDVRIAAAVMKTEWPAATPATNRARDKREGESACLHAVK